MHFNSYQQAIIKTAKYPKRGKNITYPVLGLNGEAGEVAEKIKKVIRDKKGIIDDETREALKKELGDVLWYLTMCCHEFKLDLNDVVEANLKKIKDRRNRNVLHGNGDDR